MRCSWVFICAIAADAAMAQTTWSLLMDPEDRRVRVTDVLEQEGGYLLLISEADRDASPRSRCAVVRLGPNGEPVRARHLWDESTSIYSSVLLPTERPAGGATVLGVIREGAPDAAWFYYRMDEQLRPVDSNEYIFPGIAANTLDNAVVLPENGGIVAAMGGSFGADGWPTAHVLLRLSADGDSLDSDARSSNGAILPRDILAISPDTLLVSTLGIVPSPFIQEWGLGSYSKFDMDLDLVGAFLSRPYDGSSGPVVFGNTINDLLHMSRLESGNLIISGRPSELSNVRTVVVKLGPSGTWQAVFAPRSEFLTDYPAIFRSSVLVENELLLASMENFFMGFGGSVHRPTDPNKVRIFKLDTALNTICSNVVDGFADNAYYWVDRIKATGDGGYLLCGARVDLNEPNARMVGWVRKFAPEDCFTGIGEGFQHMAATVYPNPGVDRMHVQLNGTIVSGRLGLFDMNGREVASTTLAANGAQLDTGELRSGMYAYRVTDSAGATVASGRWMKADQ